MNYSRMKDLLGPLFAQIHDHSYISNELGIVYGDPRIFMFVIAQSQPPFVIDEYRLGILVSGEIHVNINLVERHITPGTLVFFGPGTIISPISFSGKIEVYGLGTDPRTTGKILWHREYLWCCFGFTTSLLPY